MAGKFTGGGQDDKPKNRLEGAFAQVDLENRFAEQQKKPETPSVKEQIKAMKQEFKAYLQRSRDLDARIQSFEATPSTESALTALKTKSNQISKQIMAIHDEFLDVDTSEIPDTAEAARIKAAEMQRDLASKVSELSGAVTKQEGVQKFEANLAAAQARESLRQAKNLQFRKKLEQPPQEEPKLDVMPEAQPEPQAEPAVVSSTSESDFAKRLAADEKLELQEEEHKLDLMPETAPEPQLDLMPEAKPEPQLDLAPEPALAEDQPAPETKEKVISEPGLASEPTPEQKLSVKNMTPEQLEALLPEIQKGLQNLELGSATLQEAQANLKKQAAALENAHKTLESMDANSETESQLLENFVNLVGAMSGARSAEKAQKILRSLLNTPDQRAAFVQKIDKMGYKAFEYVLNGHEGLTGELSKAKKNRNKSTLEWMKHKLFMGDERTIERNIGKIKRELESVFQRLQKRVDAEDVVRELTPVVQKNAQEVQAMEDGLGRAKAGQQIMREAGLAKHELKNVRDRINKMVENRFPQEIKNQFLRTDELPETAPDHPLVTAALRQQYNQLRENLTKAQQQFDAKFSEFKAFLDGGPNALAQRGATVEATPAEVAPEVAPEAQETITETTSEQPAVESSSAEAASENDEDEFDKIELGGSDEDEDVVVSERLAREFEEHKAKIVANWGKTIDSEVANVISNMYPQYSAVQTEPNLIPAMLSEKGLKLIRTMSRIGDRIPKAKTDKEVQALIDKKNRMLSSLKELIRLPNEFHAPSYDTEPDSEATTIPERIKQAQAELRKNQPVVESTNDEELAGALPPSSAEVKDNQEKLIKQVEKFVLKVYGALMDKSHRELLSKGDIQSKLELLSAFVEQSSPKADKATRESILNAAKEVYTAIMGKPYDKDDVNRASAYLDTKNIALEMQALIESMESPLDDVVGDIKKGPRKGIVQPKEVKLKPEEKAAKQKLGAGALRGYRTRKPQARSKPRSSAKPAARRRAA